MGRTAVVTYAFPDASGEPASFTNLTPGTSFISTTGTGNKFHATIGSDAAYRWSAAGSFSNDGYAKVVLSGINASDDRIGVIGRSSADTDGARDYYYAYLSNPSGTKTLNLGKVVDGNPSSLGTDTSATWADGDTVELEYIGTTITALRNGVVLISVTDSALTTGKPGIFGKQGGNDLLRGDDFEGGDSTASTNAALSGSAGTTGNGTAVPNISIGL